MEEKQLEEIIKSTSWNEEEFDDEFSEDNYMEAIDKVDELFHNQKMDKEAIAKFIAENNSYFKLSKLQYAGCLLHIGAEDYLPEEFIELLRIEGIYF